MLLVRLLPVGREESLPEAVLVHVRESFLVVDEGGLLKVRDEGQSGKRQKKPACGFRSLCFPSVLYNYCPELLVKSRGFFVNIWQIRKSMSASLEIWPTS